MRVLVDSLLKSYHHGPTEVVVLVADVRDDGERLNEINPNDFAVSGRDELVLYMYAPNQLPGPDRT